LPISALFLTRVDYHSFSLLSRLQVEAAEAAEEERAAAAAVAVAADAAVSGGSNR